MARILVVDDSEILLAGMRKTLRGDEFDLYLANSGKEALRILPQFDPELILMDVLMPELDGYETCEQMRRDERFKDVPVLFMTALGDSRSKLRGFDVGGVDYITKPFEPDELLARCRTHLRILGLRRQLTDEIRAKQEAIDELDAFAHTVAHDLKNPIAGIVGLASCLEEVEEAMPLAGTIKDTGEKCFRIIEEILLLASIRGETVELEQVDMSQCFDEAMSNIAWLLADKGAVVEKPDSLPPCVGRAGWIGQVWMNLLSNAAKYGGESPQVSIGCQVMGDRNRYWISDDGPGLSDEQKARLFVPFSRLDQVKLEGTGLGLSIVKRIIERLHGEIGVKDSMGGGCLFYFDLPAAK